MEVSIKMDRTKKKEPIKEIYDNFGQNVKYNIELGSFRLDNDKYS